MLVHHVAELAARCEWVRKRARGRAIRWLNTQAAERMTVERMTVERIDQSDPQCEIRRWLTTIAWLAR